MSEFFDRPLPSRTASEEAVLGAVIRAGRMPEFPLSADDFPQERNRAVWRALSAMCSDGEPIDLLTVTAKLPPDETPYCAHLFDQALVTGIEHHAKVIHQCALRRKAIRAAHAAAEAAYAGDPVSEIADGLLTAARELAGETADAVRGIGADEIEAQTSAYAREISTARAPTGIVALDRIIGGLGPGQVLTILARTGVGKSAIAQNIVRAFLFSAGGGSTVFCSAEMPATELWIRQRQIEAVAGEGDVILAYREGRDLSPGFIERARRRFLCIPNANMRLSEIERVIERAVVKGEIERPQQVVFDYAKLFAAEKPTRSDTERVGEVARGVKILAKNMGVAAILLSQTGRGEKNDGTQPLNLSDARDSGEIEEAADFLVGAWRPGLNNGDPTEMKMAILKGRRCPRSEFTVRFDGRSLKIGKDWASDDE